MHYVFSVPGAKLLAYNYQLANFLPVSGATGGEPPPSPANFWDDFNRADSATLGTGWQELTGDFEILSNAAHPLLGSYAKNMAVYTGAFCTGIHQYAKFTLTYTSQSYIGVLFRYTNPSSKYMGAQFGSNEQQVFWTYYSSLAVSSTDIDAAAITFNNGDTYGITLSGVDTNTTLRIWRNPTANAPTAGDLWDGGAPTVTITTDPPTPVNSGVYIAIEAYSSTAGAPTIDNFYAGDIP